LTEKRKKIVLASVALLSIALVLTVIVFVQVHGFLHFLHNGLINLPAATPIVWPVLSNVELNVSQGFSSTQYVAGPNVSPLLVLSPGAVGTLPFVVSSPVNVAFDVSLSVYLGSPDATTYGVHFSVSPSNFAVNPGQRVTCIFTVAADQDAKSAFYLPTIEIQTNRQSSAPYVGGGPASIPALLIANYVPSCLYLVNEQELSPSVVETYSPSSAPAPTNASVPYPISVPPFVSEPYALAAVSPINLVPGQSTIVLFGCLTEDKLSLNVTASNGLIAQFSPTPTDIAFSYCTGNMYTLRITASQSIGAGSYEVNGKAELGSYPFSCSLKIAVN